MRTFGAWDTSRCLAGTARQARNQPLWEMLISDGPRLCTHPRNLLAGEPYAASGLSAIPLCGRISPLSSKCLQSRVDCSSSHHRRVPAEFPAHRISHFCIWFVQSGRVRSLSKNISCGWLTEEEWEGLLSELSAQRSCVQETSKRYINLSVRAPFPGFLTESLLQGKPRRGSNGATSFRAFHLIGMWLFCSSHASRADAVTRNLRSRHGEPRRDGEEEQEEVTEPVTKAERISRKVFC